MKKSGVLYEIFDGLQPRPGMAADLELRRGENSNAYFRFSAFSIGCNIRDKAGKGIGLSDAIAIHFFEQRRNAVQVDLGRNRYAGEQYVP